MSDSNGNFFAAELSPLIVQSIIESMALGLMVIDPKGQIVVTNKVLADILGFEQEDMLRQGWGQLFIDSEHNIEFNQVFIDVIWKETVNLQRTVPYQRPDGEVRTLTMTTSYLTTDDTMHGIVLLVEDVTQREQMRGREHRMMQAMNQLQAERSESLNKLALSVAHQIRNPMMTIGGFAGLLRKGDNVREKDLEYLDIIREEVRKLESIVTAVVEYASITSADKGSMQILDVLHLSLRRLEDNPLMQERPPEVNIQCPACSMEGDMEMLARALEEILHNALEASAGLEQPVLLLKADKGPDSITIQVEDKGVGIKKEFLPYIFDPFFTTRADKVGMGLCLAKRIALEHQGNIKVSSEPGSGTVVELQLPLE